MSRQSRDSNAVLGRLRRLAADPPTESVERRAGNVSEPARRTMPATPPDPPPRLPVRALGEYAVGGRVDAMRLERETLVFERAGADGDAVHEAGAPDGHRVPVDLDVVFPPHDPGPWPVGMSLRRDDLYDDRGR